jgi:hypothetical protein
MYQITTTLGTYVMATLFRPRIPLWILYIFLLKLKGKKSFEKIWSGHLDEVDDVFLSGHGDVGEDEELGEGQVEGQQPGPFGSCLENRSLFLISPLGTKFNPQGCIRPLGAKTLFVSIHASKECVHL